MSRWLEHAPLPMGVVRAGRLTFVNEAFGRMLGREPAELSGAPLAGIVSPADAKKVTAILEESHGKCSARVMRPDGSLRAMELWVARSGDEVIVQLCDQAERLDRTERLFCIGLEVRSGHPADAIFATVARRLGELGIACVRLVPLEGKLRVEDFWFPSAAEPEIVELIRGPILGLECQWVPEVDRALEDGAAYINDVPALTAAMLGRDVLEAARALDAKWSLEHAALLRVDANNAPNLWLVAASWLTEDDLPALGLLRAQLSAALEAGRVIGDLFERNATLAAINRLAEVASTAGGPGDLFSRYAEELHVAMAADAVSLFLIDRSTDELVLDNQYGVAILEGTPRRYPMEGTRMGEVVRSGVPVVNRRDELPPLGRALLERYGLMVVANVPLVARSTTIGVLNVSRKKDVMFSIQDLELMHAAGAHLASAIEAHRLFVDLRKSYADLARTQEQLVQRERLAAIGELAAVVAHEVRNPLGVIFNSIGTIRRLIGEEERAVTLVRILEEEATRLNHIVGDLLDFARPRIPALHPDRIESVLDEAVAAAIAGAPHTKVVREVEPELPPVPMDARLMRQALLNVAQNAVQAMPEGGTLTVRARRNGKRVFVSVQDTGNGIPPEIRPRIFEPFFTTRARGTGLGLAVVKRIIDGHGGAIDLSTEVGSGTTFTLSLPLEAQ